MDFPKLEVESHHDIRFLKVELYKAATTHLIENAKLKEFQQSLKAQGPAGDTTFQWAMGFLCSALRDWVDMVFRIAGDSILVNGESYSAAIAPKARTDPFDDKLRSETRQLQQTVEELMERVAECRTQLPQQMEQLTREFLNKQRHRTVSTRETTTLRSMGERDAGVDALNSSYRVVVPDATQQRYTRTLAEFTKVHQALPKTHSRIGKLQDVLATAKQHCGHSSLPCTSSSGSIPNGSSALGRTRLLQRLRCNRSYPRRSTPY